MALYPDLTKLMQSLLRFDVLLIGLQITLKYRILHRINQPTLGMRQEQHQFLALAVLLEVILGVAPGRKMKSLETAVEETVVDTHLVRTLRNTPGRKHLCPSGRRARIKRLVGMPWQIILVVTYTDYVKCLMMDWLD